MAKEILLYGGIFNFSAETLIAEMDEHKDEPVAIRLNTPGGDVFAGWGIIAKMLEHGDITLKVDGVVSSMGAFMLIFGEKGKREALDISKINLHRADMFVGSEEDQKFLDGVNKDIFDKLKASIDEKKFKD